MSNVYQITIFLDGILAMENYKNTHYLVCLYVKFPCRYVFIFVKHFSWEISALCSVPAALKPCTYIIRQEN